MVIFHSEVVILFGVNPIQGGELFRGLSFMGIGTYIIGIERTLKYIKTFNFLNKKQRKTSKNNYFNGK